MKNRNLIFMIILTGLLLSACMRDNDANNTSKVESISSQESIVEPQKDNEQKNTIFEHTIEFDDADTIKFLITYDESGNLKGVAMASFSGENLELEYKRIIAVTMVMENLDILDSYMITALSGENDVFVMSSLENIIPGPYEEIILNASTDEFNEEILDICKYIADEISKELQDSNARK